jgi:probable H4MPT-linked C1 transfer pathway protein
VTGSVIGWDIGGANIKAALISGASDTGPRVIEEPFPLWREPNRLAEVIARVGGELGKASRMGITMTAELADCFATKREGVAFVLDALRVAFPHVPQAVYGVDGRFRSVSAARENPLDVAAANWRASATLVARLAPDALFIDIGSTTTDVIPIGGGRVCAAGLTDLARLQTGELVYTGVLRTPVAAIARSVPVRGKRCRVAAENFAVAADVHRWLGHLSDGDYACETPDGRGVSREEAGARLARMVCADLEMLDAEAVTTIAHRVARLQVLQIVDALRQVTRRLGAACPRIAVVAGRGAFLARSAAEEVGLVCRDLAVESGPAAARAAPAVAVAYLLAEAAE